MVAPITAAASGRLSTITGTPSFFSSAGCSRRARMSEPPPGARGTTSLMGSDGYFGCALALPATRRPAVAARSLRLPIMSAPSENLAPPPLRRALAGKREAAGIDAEIDQHLGDLDGGARPLQHRHIPAGLEQPLLQQWLQP